MERICTQITKAPMSLKTLKVDDRLYYAVLALVVLVVLMLRVAEVIAVDGLEARVQTLEAAMDATQCGCP